MIYHEPQGKCSGLRSKWPGSDHRPGPGRTAGRCACRGTDAGRSFWPCFCGMIVSCQCRKDWKVRSSASLRGSVNPFWPGACSLPPNSNAGTRTWWEATSEAARWIFVNFCFGRRGGTMPPRQETSISVLRQLRPEVACTGCAAITLPSWRLRDCLPRNLRFPKCRNALSSSPNELNFRAAPNLVRCVTSKVYRRGLPSSP